MNKNPARDRPFLILLFGLAMSLRLAYWLFLKSQYFFFGHPASDVLYYQEWARSILSAGKGGEAFLGLPLYPYFLAAINLLFVGNTFLVQIFHLALGSLNCLLVYCLSRKIFPPRQEFWARLAGLLMATNFVLIHYDWLMMPVTLIITLSLVINLSLLDAESPKDWFLLGGLIGLSAFGDGKFLIFFALLIIYYCCTNSKQLIKALQSHAGPLTVGVVIVLGVSLISNRVTQGDWFLISPQSGLSFYVGNNSKASGIFENPGFIRPTHHGQDRDQQMAAEAILRTSLRPSQVSAFWFKEGLKFILNSPGDYFGLLKNKLTAFLGDPEAAYDLDLLFQRDWKKYLDINAYPIMLPLAILGMALGRKKNPAARFSLFFIFSQLIFTLIFFLTHRHRTSILPFLIIFESYALFWAAEQWKRQKAFRLLGIGIVIVGWHLIFAVKPLNPPTFDFLWNVKTGAVFEKAGNLEQAEKIYYQALAIVPRDPHALFNLGNVYFAKGNYAKAAEFYEKAISVAPHHVDALYNLAFTFEKLHAAAKALALYQEISRLEPHNAAAYFRLGQIYQQQKEYTRAITNYQNALRVNPYLKDYINPLLEACHD